MKIKIARQTNILLCMPSSLKFVDYDEDTGQFSGLLSRPLSTIFDIIKSTCNFTIVRPDDKQDSMVRDYNSKRLPGCFGMLQQGKADINLYSRQMPVIDIENVTQTNASSQQSGTYMLSPWSTKELVEIDHGPTHSFSSVTPEIWLLIALTVVIFTWMMSLTKLLRSRSGSNYVLEEDRTALNTQPVLYQVITHMMQHETCDYLGSSVRFVSILMSLFAFLFITFFESTITSEKVSTDGIQIYDSYEKILSNESVQPVWMRNLDDASIYMRAPKNSPQYKLWSQSVDISRKNQNRPVLIYADPLKILAMEKVARDKGLVFFMSNMFAEFGVGIFCNLILSDAQSMEQVKDLRLKGTLDTKIHSSLNVLPISQHSSEEVKQAIDTILRRIIEGRLMHQPNLRQMLESFIVQDVLRAKIDYNEEYNKCVDFEKIPIKDPETVPLVLANAMDVFKWWAVGCTAALIVLLVEVCTARCKARCVGRSVVLRTRR